VCTLATSLRMMAIKGAHDREQGNRKIPNNSIDCLFTILKQIQADKRHTANAWVTRTITKKQRDMLALLGLERKSAPGPEKLRISYPGVPETPESEDPRAKAMPHLSNAAWQRLFFETRAA